MAKDKRFWANVAAGTIAVVAIIFGVKQCSDKQGAREEASAWHEMVRKNSETLTNASNAVTAANERINELNGENDALRDTIVVREDTIDKLRDSLNVCRAAKDCPCKDGVAPCDCKQKKSNSGCGCKKKVAKKPATKPATKPAAKPVAKPVAKPCTQQTKPCVQAKPACKPVVEVTSGENKVVVSGACAKPDQSVIVNGDNNGQIIINSNGVVNANGNVNGHNNNVNAQKEAAREAYRQSCAGRSAVVLDSRVKCR